MIASVQATDKVDSPIRSCCLSAIDYSIDTSDGLYANH